MSGFDIQAIAIDRETASVDDPDSWEVCGEVDEGQGNESWRNVGMRGSGSTRGAIVRDHRLESLVR